METGQLKGPFVVIHMLRTSSPLPEPVGMKCLNDRCGVYVWGAIDAVAKFAAGINMPVFMHSFHTAIGAKTFAVESLRSDRRHSGITFEGGVFEVTK